MNNSYYGSSFIISSLIYVALGLSLYTFLENSPLKPIKTIDKPIKIAIVTPIPKPKPKVVKPAPTPPKEETIKPKPKPKKVVKKIVKKPKPKPKKITKKIIKKVYKKPKPKPKKIIEKPAPIQEEFFIPEPYPQTESVETPPTPVVTQPVVQPKVDKSAKRRAFLKAVRGKIVRNKKYPPTARRRHIEGSVEVMFDIGTDGSISNIQFLNGKRILQKSVRRAILNSSPLLVPNSLQSELPIYGISVVVHFKLN